jgi:hypothetical protein
VQLASRTPSAFAWRILGCATAVLVPVGWYLGFTAPLYQVGKTLLLCGGLLAASEIGRRQFKSDAAAEVCALFAFWIAMLAVLLPASYIAAAFNAPLIDATLQALDRAIGFDWLALQRWTDATEWGAVCLTWLYQASIIQIPIAVFVLAGRRELQRLNAYVTGLMLATLATIVVSAVLPAAGAYRAYGVVPNPYGAIVMLCDVSHFLPDFDAVRSGALRTLGGPLDGIIQFPSFHTVVAVTAAWATWRTHWIGPANAIFALLVLVSTLPIGSHHLMDVVGGVAVSVLGVYAATRLEAPVGSAPHQKEAEQLVLPAGKASVIGRFQGIRVDWKAWFSQFLTAMTARR